ncbi:hypothetical protein GCM10023340_06520 [Nocardioides marinquilinus]|uniref:Flp pilus-assembly TadG-like N-terminal domain-containing protein n=1 Tax=Nocardioides marinquilinus TaxID=1210400 RepID=A0ABP9PAP6_9ACTN
MTRHRPPRPDAVPARPADGAAAEPRDRGSAVLVVLATMTILAVFASVALNSTVRTMSFADRQQDWNQALSAAEAGVADYLARLNRDDMYWQTTDCTNQAMRRPMTTSNACSWNSTTKVGWLPVPGSARAQFHYDVDIATTYTNGTIALTSTGRVGEITRTVAVRLRRGGFGEFLYYTVYETIDPADENVYGLDNATAQEVCTRYDWPSLPASQRRNSGCSDINFVSGDVINGPLHSNDAILMLGSPRFKGTTSTSLPSCRAVGGVAPPVTSCYVRTSSASPIFERGISYRAEVELPTTIGDLRQYVTPGRVEASRLGCLYTGPTRIKFLPPSAGATPKMQVWSKATTAADLNPGCGTAGTASGRLGHSAGQVVDVPNEKLILVQDIPAGRKDPATNKDYTAGWCKTEGGIGDGIPRAGTSGTYPDYDVNLNLRETDCRYGTAFVQGTLRGRVTIATDNNVIVTGDTVYSSGENGTDALGLIAKNSVKIYHPVKCTRKENGECTQWANLTGTLQNVNLNAAILTLQHSFGVQTYYKGAKLGTLRVFGTIAQRFRGPVGTTSGGSSVTGYLKNYIYDTRLRYAPPPYFLDPVRSGWGQKTFGEVVPKYR